MLMSVQSDQTIANQCWWSRSAFELWARICWYLFRITNSAATFAAHPQGLIFAVLWCFAIQLCARQNGWGLTGCWMVRLSLLMWWTMPEMQRGPAKPSRSARKRNVMLRIRGLPNALLKACQIHFGPWGAVPWGLWCKTIKRAEVDYYQNAEWTHWGEISHIRLLSVI